jgi:phosphoglycerol transferase MdoB-like AlkP superfamily enzyme
LPGVFLLGWFFDTVYYLYVLIPISLYLWLTPQKIWRSGWNRLFLHVICFITVYVMGFTIIAEFLFWNEFNVRFNFISVDYLVYRREVSNNIFESYPVIPLLIVLFFFSLLVYRRFLAAAVEHVAALDEPFASRMKPALANFALAGLCALLVSQSLRGGQGNVQLRELAGNGPYQLFAAFRNNELDYNEFYLTYDREKSAALLRQELQGPNVRFETPSGFDIRRRVKNAGSGPKKKLNVMLVMVESLSASFMGAFGNEQGLTPNLDRLAGHSLFFANMYATGTRTTRGLEAVTLSIPPTPGRSIVKRIGREKNMWSLGNVLSAHGYDVRFLYGGRGYFDNMNAFFSGNGYKVIDQTSTPSSQIGFANAWGMADEYLFSQALKAADKAAAGGRPFFFHIMSTSNHRPYSYPEGRIDIPSGAGRHGAVKYTDWAIGDFLARARGKSWFANTLFVIIADHTAGGAGKQDLPVSRYHIPMLIYAPELVAPARVETMASQIDVAPTLLAMLGIDYESFAYGRNIFALGQGKTEAGAGSAGGKRRGRALIANYQYLGYLTPARLSVLGPRKSAQHFYVSKKGEKPLTGDKSLARDKHLQKAIAYYEGAYAAFSNGLNRWRGTSSSAMANRREAMADGG